MKTLSLSIRANKMCLLFKIFKCDRKYIGKGENTFSQDHFFRSQAVVVGNISQFDILTFSSHILSETSYGQVACSYLLMIQKFLGKKKMIITIESMTHD